MKRYIFTLISTLVFLGCSDNTAPINIEGQEQLTDYVNIKLENLPNYIPNYPVHYSNQVQNQDNSPNSNTISQEGATLGRVLFYDKNLSRTNTIACATCHKQENGFGDLAKLSLGIDGQSKTTAHSMRLGNANFYIGESMFWDKRAESIEDQSTQPVQNEVEMGFDINHGGIQAAIEKISDLPYYPVLFKAAFGSEEITEDKMQKAIAQFVRSLVSINSKFDTGFATVYNPNVPGNNVNANFSNFTAQENRGKSLFVSPPNNGGFGCAGCHQPPTFALDPNSRSNGLDLGETVIFKAPSLKNVGLDGAFMHDGRFSSLEEVIQHYSNGITNGNALDNRLRNPQGTNPVRLNISTEDSAALIAFLNTLTDDVLIKDTKFSDPFIN